MKKNLLKTLLVAAGMVMGVNGAWAEPGDEVINANIDCTGEIIDNVLTGAVNTMAIGTGGAATEIVNNSYMKLGDHDNVVTIPEDSYAGTRDAVEISFDMAWGNKNGMGNGIALKDAAGENIAYFKYARWGGGTNDMDIDFSNILGGHSSNKAVWNNKTHFVITIDYAKKTVSTVATFGSTTKTFATTITNTNPIATFTVNGYNAGGNADRAGLFGNLIIKTIEGDYNIPTAKYSVLWVEDGTVIQEDNGREGDVNDNITLLPADLANFFVGDVKYIVTGNDVEGKTISSDGSTVVKISVRKAERWAYTITSSYNEKNLDWSISDEVWEDENNITIHYPRYQKYNNILVGREPNGNDLTVTVTINKNGYTEDIKYTSDNINIDNLYMLSEAENLGTGLAESGTSYNTRVSGGKIIHGSEGKLLSLPPGKYILTLGAIGGDNNSHSVKYNVSAGEKLIIEEGVCEKNMLTLIPSTEFTLFTETDITFTSSDQSSDRGIDLIYVQKTGDITELPITLSTEYEYSTYCNADFALDFTDNADVKAYAATVDEENNRVVLTEVMQVPAGEGVVLKNISNATSATVNVIATAAPIADNAMVGVKEAMDAEALVADNAYILNANNKFHRVGSGATNQLAAGKAYLRYKATEGSEARLTIVIEDSVTAVADVTAPTSECGNVIYNLQGVRVQNMTAPGLYIVNGKTVVVK